MKKSVWGVLVLVVGIGLYYSFRPLPDEPGLTVPEAVQPFLNGNFPDISAANQEYTIAFPNLTFNSPLTFTVVPNTQSLIVGQRNGQIYWFENNENVTQKNLLLDMSNEVGVVWDGGFLGLAIHPEFGQPNKNYFYIYYTTKDSQGRDYPNNFVSGFSCNQEDYWGSFLILKRISVDPTTLTVNAAEDLVMLKMRMFGSTHRGGGLTFGDDGFLYLTTGDQSAYSKSQNTTTNLDGGVLRLDVDQNPIKSHAPIKKLNVNGRFPDEISGDGYWIPNDNPFLSGDGSRFEEYYTVGHRNPHRMTKDRLTGTMYIGEVGESRHEEINVLKKGENYGWPVYEGNYFRGTGCTDLLDEMPHESPLVSFPRSEANALIGGYVYRGTSMPSYYGKYICADYGVGEEIWAVDIVTGAYEVITQFSPTDIISFGEDNDGELYLLSQGNNVPLYQLTESGEFEGTIPQRLSETGAFEDLQTMEPAQGLIPYNLIESFWSDGAEKQRWMAIPNNGSHNTPDEQISFSENGDWDFPVGAVLVKHFELPIDENNPSLTKKLETRFSVKASNGSFYFVTYKWNAQETEAFLLETGIEEAIAVTKNDGSTAYQTWSYPSTADCISCHNPATGGTLGPRTRYLNSELTYEQSGVTANQLVTLSHLGILNEIIDEPKTQGYQTHKAINDVDASLDEKARSYLDLNCAYCHRPGATGERAQFDLQLFQNLAQTGLLNAGINTPLGIDGEKIVVPNDASKSILFHRMNSVDQTIAMPPIAKNKIDVAGVQLIEEWINQLAAPLPIPTPGDYRIVNKASGGTLQIPSVSLADRVNVAVGTYEGLDHQHFAFEEVGNGYYRFRALHSDKYIDVELGGTTAGTNVWQYVGNGTDAQLWELIDTGEDSFYVVSKLSGFYLGTGPDGNVAVLDDTSNATHWEFLPIGEPVDIGIAVQTTSISTSENEDTANLEISLKSAPAENVIVLLSGTDNTDEYSLSTSELTFTAFNWNTPQNVTVTGIDDAENDGTQLYTITIMVDDSRSDGSYAGFSVTVTGENLDNDGNDCTGLLSDVSEPVGSGTITSRNDFVPAEDRFKAFDNRRTFGDHSKWLDGAGVPTLANPSWIQLELELPKRVETITLTSANDDYGRDPKDFRLMASNGGAFTEVGSWSSQEFSLRYQTRTFELLAPGTYTTYRLEITKNDEDVALTQLAEIELLGCEPDTSGIVQVTDVELSPESLEILIGSSVQLQANVLPGDATDKTILWASSNPLVATVDITGNVTSQTTGNTVITATSNDGGFTAATTITVKDENVGIVQVTTVNLAISSFELINGAMIQAIVTVLPVNATDKSVSWSSEDPSIASVDEAGNITAQGIGNTVIRVSTNDGGFTAFTAITVEENSTGTTSCNGILTDVSEPVGSGIITSRNDFVPAEDKFKAFDNKRILGDHSKWLDGAGIPTASNPSWIQIALETPKRVEAITITSANDDYGRDPKDFRLMASNGSTFTEVGSWSGQTFTLRYQTRTFDLSAPGTYTTYRLEITKNDENVPLTQLAEIELFGCEPEITEIVEVTNISTSAASLEMEIGDIAELIATVVPNNATDKTVSWTSEDNAIASVNSNGNVTAQGSGSTIITVTSNDGGFFATTTITVQEPVLTDVSVTDVNLSASLLELETGAIAELVATILPANATNKAVSWASDDVAVATVDNNGNVTAQGTGNTLITVTSNDGGFTAATSVIVEEPVIGIDTCNGTLTDMTNPVGSGTITSRNDFIPAEDRFKAFDNKRIQGDHSKWLDSAGIPTTANPSWIQLQLVAPKRVEAITITSANDDYGRDPKDFRLMASNGGAFTQVGSWSSQEFSLRYQTRTFDLSAPGTFTTYRLEITRNDEGVELTQLAEIELLGCDEPGTIGNVPVTGVQLQPESLAMIVGAITQVNATVLPSNATDKTLNWSIQNPAIALVDAMGNITALAIGNTVLTASTNDGNFTATTLISVEQEVISDGTCGGILSDVSEPIGSGTITSRNDFIPAEDRFKAFDNRRVQGNHTKWLDSAGIPTASDPSWIQIALGVPKRVESITITSANDDYGRDPKDFRLMASNGGAFTEVGRWSGQEFSLRYQTRTFELSAPGSYSTYRLEITKNDEGVEMTQLAELELLGCEPQELNNVTLSARLNVNIDYPQEDVFTFSPNPVGEERIISLQLTNALTDTQVTITVYSIDGKLVNFFQFWNGKETFRYELQLDQSLPTGVYLMEVKNNKQNVYRKKIIFK